MGLVRRKEAKGAVYYIQFNVREQDGKLYLDPNGNRKRWKAVPDKRESRKQEAIIKTKLLQGLEIEPQKQPPIITLRQYVEQWKPGAKRNLAPRTYAGYEQILDQYILSALGNRDIKSISWADVKALLVAKQNEGYATTKKAKQEGAEPVTKHFSYSQNTLRLIRATLSSILSEAAEDGVIPTNPLIGQRRRRGAKAVAPEVKAMTWEQKQAFESKVIEMESTGLLSPAYAALLLLMLHTGLRPGEARALKPGDIDFMGSRLRVERSATLNGAIKSTKTGEPRWVDLGPVTIERLKSYLTCLKGEAIARGKEAEWLFPSETGTLLDDRHIARAMRRVLTKAELPSFSLYDLRHTYASLLLSAGVPLLYVAHQLGHTKPTITLKYYARWIPSGSANHAEVLERTLARTLTTPATETAAPVPA
ncbi:MAG TPA: tyrosine-type recombinase/integrase [Nitrospira sp.]|nr:tyrosine-type recombinase/integrase [Nitrospira sp.]